KLTKQEIRNAVYSGTWVTAAKRKFSKSNCVAYKLGQDYMSGNPIRQDYLEKVIHWISDGEIEKYMAIHQNDSNADKEWQYFQSVIAWVKILFPKYRREMKGVDWGCLYNKFKNNSYSTTELEEKVKHFMMDDDITAKKGIYEYLLSGDERKLNIRAFTDNMKREAYERQKGICPKCNKYFEIERMQGDHITPWCKGGKTIAENCQMLCVDCNRIKGGK
ncbi:MAG: HNH endonuclease, partial [Muribaculaceae bacterium]|nr:HNH endonuclease [Muribaculaceae bacterium]